MVYNLALIKLKGHEHAERLGKSEIELVNIFIEGLAAIIKLEQKLEAGEDIETDIALVRLYSHVWLPFYWL